jgi:hypothetical protein
MNLRALLVTSAGVLAILFTPAAAGPRDDVLEAMGKCSTLTEDKARLACYDAVAPKLRDALNVPPETLSGPPTKEQQESWFGLNWDHLLGSGSAPPQQTTPEKFGADNLPRPEAPPPVAGAPAAAPALPEQLDSITAKVTDYSINPLGRFIVFLDNGQVWKEIDVGTAHFESGGNTVMIERGMIGAYNMHINGSNKVYRVQRLK